MRREATNGTAQNDFFFAWRGLLTRRLAFLSKLGDQLGQQFPALALRLRIGNTLLPSDVPEAHPGGQAFPQTAGLCVEAVQGPLQAHVVFFPFQG
jgi:hypothetical protein